MRNGDRSGRLCSEKKKKVTRSAPREKILEEGAKVVHARTPTEE